MESAAELLICPACRARNLDDARFCSQCGIRLWRDADAADEPPPMTESDSMVTDRTLDLRTDSTEEVRRADPLIGVVVADRYRIIELLGRGGMGVVYKVEHARIGKLMALKLLTGELGRDTELVSRFKREALMASKLSHPNTVQVFDFGSSEGLTYLAMELLRGNDLGRIVRHGGPLGPMRASKIVVQICSSLAEAHDQDIIHRDLKPENIMILRGQSGDDVVKVLDFGLAKLRESKELGDVTTRGAIVGTPFYMSPEQIRGEPVDARSDVYSLGALMYACLTGHPVFDAQTPMGILTKHLTEEPVPPNARDPDLGIPLGLSRIVLRCLEKQPADRYQSVRELQQALVESLRGEGGISGVDVLLDSKHVRRLADQDAEAATRAEVERYERKLQRRGAYAWAVVALVLGVLVVAGYKLWFFQRSSSPFNGAENEPNNSASDADPLPFGVEVRGQIGRRLARQQSDRDFYRVDVPADVTTVSLRLTGLPNMAICAWLYKVGVDSPLGRYCPGSAATDLSVGALSISPGSYLLAVMQDRDSYSTDPAPPVLENVSDVYRLQMSRAVPAPDREIEPNDTTRDANSVKPGATFRGKFSWVRDVDVVCVAAGSGRVGFSVTDSPRSRYSVLQVTPRGGKEDGVPVRVHGEGSDNNASARDVQGEWHSGEIDTASAPACLELTLVPNPWAPLPHPTVAPAGDQEYTVRVEPR